MTEKTNTFGDNVTVRDTEDTRRVGVAGLTGQVHGQTTPSNTGVEVVGPLAEDYAIHVYFDELDTGFWFASELLTFVDHAPGTEITIGQQRRIRSESGEWVDPAETKWPPERPWWKFW